MGVPHTCVVTFPLCHAHPVDAVGPQCLFCDGDTLSQIKAEKEVSSTHFLLDCIHVMGVVVLLSVAVAIQGGFKIRRFTTICSPMPCVEEVELELSQKSVICSGRTKYNPQESPYTLCEWRPALLP